VIITCQPDITTGDVLSVAVTTGDAMSVGAFVLWTYSYLVCCELTLKCH